MAVYIGSLLYTIDEEALKKWLTTDMGLKSVEEVVIYRTPAGKSKGGAKVVFKDAGDFKRCLQLHGEQLKGRPLKVNDFFLSGLSFGCPFVLF